MEYFLVVFYRDSGRKLTISFSVIVGSPKLRAIIIPVMDIPAKKALLKKVVTYRIFSRPVRVHDKDYSQYFESFSSALFSHTKHK